ncbi:MAG: hypothetical protein HC922_00695 [Leptolyngbyaceae cyanobacterium SM2_3_12]|nr:hypothetical protein [Leptolyngbyaceae cyanobacterium SM2_3_12]
MRNPNQRLLTILGLGWLAFWGLGLGLRQALSGTAITVVIDRSYCSTAQWQPLTNTYANLYAQHQQRRLVIDQVIYISDLGQEVATTIPSPEEVRALSTYGRFNATQMQQVTETHPNAMVLSCEGGQP